MNKPLVIALAMGAVVMGMLVSVFYKGSEDYRLTLEAELRKIRVVETSPASSIALVDFRLQNRSNVQFVLREAKVVLVKADGSELDGDTQPRDTVNRIFEYLPAAGGKINEVLIPSDKIGPKALIDRMAGSSFSIPVAELEARKHFRVELIDLDGGKFVMTEKRK